MQNSLRDRIKSSQRKKEDKGKISDPPKGKAPEYTHYILSHSNIGVIEDLFQVSFPSSRDVLVSV